MLKIHFTESDISNITIIDSAAIEWEILGSLYRMRRPEGQHFYGSWRNSTRTVLSDAGRMLMSAVPTYGYCPDFLTPEKSAATPDELIDQLLATETDQVASDIHELSTSVTLAPWLRQLGDGDQRSMRRLGDSFSTYFYRHIEPEWRTVNRVISAEISRLHRMRDEGNIHFLLSSLHPELQWRNPVLKVRFPVDQEVALDGRGLTLIPSYFIYGMPTAYRDAARRPVLVYSVRHRSELVNHTEPGAALSALLGASRARVLLTLMTGRYNTSELAGKAGISLSSASEHITVLRETGLASSSRIGRSRYHEITPLGTNLIRAS
ncbi:ArsR/SmtB family transcription factor [Saccharomonospora xinjiangensis]|uniref:ArsR/SmtB family transcription factor n=1 Tax=Saccharomonospora xinjiangensis TaxID=75294 RepID=UPI003510AEE1